MDTAILELRSAREPASSRGARSVEVFSRRKNSTYRVNAVDICQFQDARFEDPTPGERTDCGFHANNKPIRHPAMTKAAQATTSTCTTIGVLLVFVYTLFNYGEAPAKTAEEHFPRPPDIEKAVEFWTRVYSEADSNSGFVHDSRSLDIIYEVYPLPKYASPKRQHRLIRKRIRHYRQLLKKIADTPVTKLNPEQLRIKRLWGSDASSSKLRRAAKRIRFQRGQSDRMDKGLKRAVTYEKRIRKILRDKGVPEQLVALPHVESSYNPKVRSKAGAAGLWQIMPATGRRFLRVSNVVDERLDPYKATAAAAQLLQHNYSVLQSWPLAITAYNHGLSGVRRAVRKTGAKEIETIVRQYQGRSFGFASRNFYAAFLAAYDVSTKRRANGREKNGTKVPVVALNAFISSDAIAAGLRIDKQTLKQHNPDLGATVWSGEKYIPKGYELSIPTNLDSAVLNARVAELEKRSGHAQQIPDRYYRVRRGDNLAAIAQRHDTSIGTLMAMNNLRSRHRINAGQVLRIPDIDEAPLVTASVTSQVGKKSTESAAVIPAVAKAEQIVVAPVPVVVPKVKTVQNKASAADIVSESEEPLLEESETVVIAQSDLAADPADYLVAEDGTIEVQVGETLGHYAHWLSLPTQQLRALNGMRYGQHVIVGKRLKLSYAAVEVNVFELKRKNFHSAIQNRFFANHHIIDVKDHALTNGDNLWELSTQTYQIPLWLLRQYNPDLALDTVLSLSSNIRVPVIQASDDSAMSPPTQASRTSNPMVGLKSE